MPAARLPVLAATLILLATHAAPAQPPKQKPRKIYSAAEVADAETKLAAANCTLHRSEPERPVWEEGLPPAPGPRPAIDVVGFPSGEGSQQLNDTHLGILLPFARKLPGLKVLKLWNTGKITARGLKLLTKELPDLEGLILDQVAIRDDDLAELTNLKSLAWLQVVRCPVSNAGLKHVAAIPRLATLTLIKTPGITPEGLAALKGTEQLRALHVDISGSPQEFATAIAKLGQLSHVHAYPVGDEEAAELGKMGGILTLDLTAVQDLTDEHPLRPWEFAAPLTDAGLRSIAAGCRSLEVLRVVGRAVTAAGVRELGDLETLTELSLAYTGTTDAGAEVVARVKSLRRLDLSGTRVTDAGARELADLPKVETLDLSSTRIGDAGLKSIARLRTLQSLRLDGTVVSATDGTDLGTMAGLKYLSMQSTNATVASLRQLATARSVLLYDLRWNCPNLRDPDVQPLRNASHRPRVFANKNCDGSVSGWAGAVGYAFRVPTPVSARSPNTPVPPGMGVPTPTPNIAAAPPGMGTATPTPNVGMGQATPTVGVPAQAAKPAAPPPAVAPGAAPVVPGTVGGTPGKP